MNAEPNSLSSGPLVYFLIHSGTFVLLTASLFFVLGLVFGWLTWSRHRRAARRLSGELEGKKDEIALLKRTLAEHTSRLPIESEDEDTSRDSNRYLNKPDLVLGSFLATASSLLPDPLPQERGSSPIAESIKVEDLPTTAPIQITRVKTPEITIKPSVPAAPTPQPVAVIEPPSSSPTPSNVLKSLIVGTVSHPTPEPESKKETELAAPAPLKNIEKKAPQKVKPTTPPPSTPPPSASTPEPALETKPQEPTNDSTEVIRLVSDPHLGLVFRTRPQTIDDLSQLKGVASGIESRLNELGVYTFKQIALWSDENIIEFSRLLSFKDRIHREQWVDQARELHYHTYNERV
jgi:predicted flap endonuclease-1-like 5' DNA nuclease